MRTTVTRKELESIKSTAEDLLEAECLTKEFQRVAKNEGGRAERLQKVENLYNAINKLVADSEELNLVNQSAWYKSGGWSNRNVKFEQNRDGICLRREGQQRRPKSNNYVAIFESAIKHVITQADCVLTNTKSRGYGRDHEHILPSLAHEQEILTLQTN